ncbi:MAG: D-amino-acid transaminase [Ignavibacterium sp.]|nr:D-amino-acid transaminase [Ignavibacterium sp.]
MKMIVYFNDKYIPHDDVKISPFDRAFLFADGVYEALRTYNGKLFRLQDHLERLKYSLQELEISFNDFDQLENISTKLAEINNIKTDYSVYLQISRGTSFPRTHNYESNLIPNVFVFVKPIKDNSKEISSGVKVILEKDLRWLRCDIKSTSLLPAIIANQNAVRNNAFEAILFRDDFITEGSHTNFFAIKNNKIYTAPLSNYILNGITRKVILELCRENKIDFSEEYINVNELKSFDEFFLTGTTTEVTPVIKIDDLIVGNEKPGNITRSIQELFFNSVKQV